MLSLNCIVQHFPEISHNYYLARLNHIQLKGMIADGPSVRRAFKELMISLKIKIEYDYKNDRIRNLDLVEII